MKTEQEWNEINEAIAIDGEGKATGLHYSPLMACEYCGQQTRRDAMVWVGVYTFNGIEHQKFCLKCADY
jgi:hypothetical protein